MLHGFIKISVAQASLVIICVLILLQNAVIKPSIRLHDENGYVLATIAVPNGFTLSFFHSINLSPVDEEFTVEYNQDKAMISLNKVIFNQLSTGMPFDDSEGFLIENGRFVTKPKRLFSKIELRVSPIHGHVLKVGKNIWPLTRWVNISELIRVQAL